MDSHLEAKESLFCQDGNAVFVIDSGLVGEVSRGEKIALRGTDPESYITENNLVNEN